MPDPKKDMDLTAIWVRAGVIMDTNVLRPAITKKNKKKKKGTSTSGGQPEPEKVIDLKAQPEARPTEQGEDTSAPTPPPSSSKASPEANKKRQKEDIEEKLSERGRNLPSISDLCMRVGQSGLALFKELAELMAGELSKCLEDNKGFKEELEQLKKVVEDLEAANQKVAEQKRQLKRIPAEEKELQESRQRAEKAEAREQELKTRVEKLSKVADDLLEQLAWGSKRGFDRAVQIVVALEPSIEFKYFNGLYEARDGKIYEGE